MNGLEKFQIGRSQNFERTLQKQIRDRYRKNPAGRAEFVELIQRLIYALSENPCPSPPLGHLEPWPKGTKCAGWELWKLQFKMPHISRGAAAQGRLIFLVNAARKKVALVWIYTHAEFKKRPPDNNLKSVILPIIEASETLGKKHNSANERNADTEEKEVGEK